MAIAQPKKPLVCRYGQMVVRLDAAGIALRGFRMRRWRRVTWGELAWLMSHEETPAVRAWSEREGMEFLEAIGAR
jgi:hypothetical protein